MPENIQRRVLTVEGQIQGVGFRPFVWRLAHELGVTGHVRNSSAGVRIEIQGSPNILEIFEKRLKAEAPPLAKIAGCLREDAPVISDETDFHIEASETHGGQKVLASPDVAICPECLADIRDPANPRYGYAFTNCVNCGPRYSIISQIPYDRKTTVMSCFPLCESCSREYRNPADRRFHAQPIACPDCGPSLWLVDKASTQTSFSPANAEKALERSARLLAEGKILALKGLGGFQLACDAGNAASVLALRERKSRPHKAFAIMAGSMEAARDICEINDETLKILEGPAHPIVVCPARKPSRLALELAPDSNDIGLMLPNTPLHCLLFDELKKFGIKALVMTSGNLSGEPICLGNREALQKLDKLADAWLLHNRDILTRVDDSVIEQMPPGIPPVFIRRARGYVPEGIPLGPVPSSGSVLGSGAQLKASFCLTRDNLAFVSQHLGDLDSPASQDFYEESLSHLQALLECRPEAIVHDLHPDYLSSQMARELAAKLDIPVWSLQHHAAHAASVLAENGIYEPCLALCLDGTGLGDDNTIWGGELLQMDLCEPVWQRIGSLSSFALPGGEMAIKNPWRIALALDENWKIPTRLEREGRLARKLLHENVSISQTSSCGRLFDAVAARLDLCDSISYEGQAAMRLMQAAGRAKAPDMPMPVLCNDPEDNLIRIDSREIFRICAEIHEKSGPNTAAMHFHILLAESLAEMCLTASTQTGIRKVALSGGVMVNRVLVAFLLEGLARRGLTALSHKKLPPGDGGLSLGQAVWGRQLLHKKA